MSRPRQTADPLTVPSLFSRRLPLGRPPIRNASPRSPMEGRGRDSGRQDNLPQTHATRLGGITRLLRIRLPRLRAQPPHPFPQQEAHLAMTPHDLFRRIHVCFLFRRIPLGRPPARAKDHHHDVERGGRIAGTPRHAPDQTVHRSRRDELSSSLFFTGVCATNSTSTCSPYGSRNGTDLTALPTPSGWPCDCNGRAKSPHAQHHKALLTARLRDDVVHLP